MNIDLTFGKYRIEQHENSNVLYMFDEDSVDESFIGVCHWESKDNDVHITKMEMVKGSFQTLVYCLSLFVKRNHFSKVVFDL